jgi:hypothetical protein
MDEVLNVALVPRAVEEKVEVEVAADKMESEVAVAS